MKIGLISHAFPPSPPNPITKYHEETAKALAEAGHEVHVVTNQAWFGATSPRLTARYWREGNLHIHRIPLFDENGTPPSFLRFFDLDPRRYAGRKGNWAFETYNMAALHMANFVALLHTDIGIDVLEIPEHLAEGFYIIRGRIAGRKHFFPPVSLTSHGTTRSRLRAQSLPSLLGVPEKRRLMLREEFCVRNADGLLTLTPGPLKELENVFGEPLPPLRNALNDPGDLNGKIAHLEKIAEAETDQDDHRLGPFTLPPRLLPGCEPGPIPYGGIILIDANDSDPEKLRVTVEAVQESIPGSENWELQILSEKEVDVPHSWPRLGLSGPLPWKNRLPTHLLVYILAGTHLDFGAIHALVSTSMESKPPSGSFLWVRPGDTRTFPYRPDMSRHEILLGAGILPPVFCTFCGALGKLETLVGLDDCASRIAAIMSVAASNGYRFLHTGEVQGDFYGGLPTLHDRAQAGATGYLDFLGLIPRDLVTFGDTEPLGPPVLPRSNTQGSPSSIPIDELERVYRQHQNLKNMAPVRWLKKLGVLSLTRKIFPGIKNAIGPGEGVK